MTLREKFLKKKLKELKERYPGIDVGSIEKELYPMGGDDLAPVTAKKKRKDRL